MKRNINSSWQEWVIAIALVVVLPATIWLGLQVVCPKVEYENYSRSYSNFFKEYREKGIHDYESKEYKKLDAGWKKTDAFKTHERQLCINNFVKLLVGGTLSIALLYIGTVFFMPIISSACIMSALILHQMCAFWGSTICPTVYGLNMHLLSILFALVGLLVILRAAYRDSKD
ncbi:MAG: hypothetical protein NTU89_00575 [Candidatus Dependentiae bacterium]|nr:hypothetical protein [Candidatus Dependentiae bacterium]